MGGSRILAVAVLLSLLAACGFQPRGALQVPPGVGPLRVQAPDPFNPVAAGLTRALERAGAGVVDGADPSSGVLRLRSERWEEGPLLTDNTARVREYVTRYRVDFELTAVDGSIVVPRQTVELSREYAYDATAAFGTSEEQEVIRDELRRDMVAAILRRVDAALGTR